MSPVVEHELECRLARELRPLDLVDVVHADGRELAGVRTLEGDVPAGQPQQTVVLKCHVEEVST